MKQQSGRQSLVRKGFTIVELIVVIVVIAVLATIVVVSYDAVRNNAVDISLQSDLDTASGLIEKDRMSNNGTYPADAATLNGGRGLVPSGSNVFTYTSVGTAYCILITSPEIDAVYNYNSTTQKITEGECANLDVTGDEVVTTLVSGLSRPTGIAMNSTEFMYISETNQNRILKVMANGTVSVFAGSTAGASGMTNATGTAARFNQPYGIGIDSAGNVYVADTGNHQIRKITPAGVVTLLAGSTTGASGTSNGTGTAARFNDPYAVSIDPATDEIFVTETYAHRIRAITSAGVVSSLAGGTMGYANGNGTSARFDDPLGMTFKGSYIYIAEYSNHTIRRVTKTGDVITLLGTNSAGFTDATGSNARFNQPTGLAVRGNSLFIADAGNQRVRVANLTNNTVTTYAGSGVDGSSNGSAQSAQFSFPTGVAAGPDGAVYVVETDAGRIRKIQ